MIIVALTEAQAKIVNAALTYYLAAFEGNDATFGMTPQEITGAMKAAFNAREKLWTAMGDK